MSRKFIHGPGHIFNPVPTNHEECIAHGNALAASGNYPVGTSDCFNVGISGGCGPKCFIYLEGRCSEPGEALLQWDMTEEEKIRHKSIYG